MEEEEGPSPLPLGSRGMLSFVSENELHKMAQQREAQPGVLGGALRDPAFQEGRSGKPLHELLKEDREKKQKEFEDNYNPAVAPRRLDEDDVHWFEEMEAEKNAVKSDIQKSHGAALEAFRVRAPAPAPAPPVRPPPSSSTLPFCLAQQAAAIRTLADPPAGGAGAPAKKEAAAPEPKKPPSLSEKLLGETAPAPVVLVKKAKKKRKEGEGADGEAGSGSKGGGEKAKKKKEGAEAASAISLLAAYGSDDDDA
eukprot:tig00000788_g4076.t1